MIDKANTNIKNLYVDS